jgi:hypothetical protein
VPLFPSSFPLITFKSGFFLVEVEKEERKEYRGMKKKDTCLLDF